MDDQSQMRKRIRINHADGHIELVGLPGFEPESMAPKATSIPS